ncbi:Cell surface GPI-anchored protein ECM33 [Fusarium oxysporum f. sp. albedinis]|nr:Cell surface GPI-anchored protein ECM33 [Fusarium oxysporum f. sp. albedinis]
MAGFWTFFLALKGEKSSSSGLSDATRAAETPPLTSTVRTGLPGPLARAYLISKMPAATLRLTKGVTSAVKV